MREEKKQHEADFIFKLSLRFAYKFFFRDEEKIVSILNSVRIVQKNAAIFVLIDQIGCKSCIEISKCMHTVKSNDCT